MGPGVGSAACLLGATASKACSHGSHDAAKTEEPRLLTNASTPAGGSVWGERGPASRNGVACES